MAHARVKPSAAGQWIKCPGSIIMRERFPETGRSESAEEGTAAHWVASEMLQGRISEVGQTAPNGWQIDQDMVDGAKIYCQSIMSFEGLRTIEQPLNCPSVHESCFGTPDCWVWNPNTRELHIFDYKYGFGIVEPRENWQLLCYASGAIAKLGYPVGQIDQHVTVHLHIVQPRAYHVLGPHRSRWISGGALRGYTNKLEQAARLALSDNPQVCSGEHCRYCSARHACPAAQKDALAWIDYASPQELPPEALAVELQILRRAATAIQNRLTGLEGQAIGLIQSGQYLPGWSLENGKGRQVWKSPHAEIIAMGQMFGIDLAKPPEAITPVQAKKAGFDPEMIRQFSETPISGLKLVPTDKSIASEVFRNGAN